MQLLELHNVVFALPLLAAVLLVLGMALGIPLMHHDVHAADFHGLDGGSIHGHGPEVHGDGGHVSGGLLGFLGFLGIGRVPFIVTLLSWFMVWGASGLILNQVRPDAEAHLGSTVMMSVVLTLTGTGWVSRMIANLIPAIETYATPNEQLEGIRGQVLHGITESGGTVRLMDPSGNLRDVSVVLRSGQASIERGTPVMVGRFDAEREVFEVEPLGVEAGPAMERVP